VLKNRNKLKQDPNRSYFFKSPIKTQFIRFVDTMGSFFFHEKKAPIVWRDIKRIAVLRLDHLGDVLLALPFLEALRMSLPQLDIDLYAGPWAEELIRLAGFKIGFKVFNAPWFDRANLYPWSLKGIQSLSRKLAMGRYDAVIDLRGDFRQIIAMKCSGIPIRIGQIRTGGGFLLTHPLVYRKGLHEIDRNLEILSQLGLNPSLNSVSPKIIPADDNCKSDKQIRRTLSITKPVIALHCTCLASAKRWGEEKWRQLAESLPDNVDIVVLGSKNEQKDAEKIFNGCQRKVVFAMGLFSLGDLAAFLKACKLFIGVDSAPAHIAASVGTPVISLFSGTNESSQWSPRGPKVMVLQKKTSCSPCELMVCPIANECMNQIIVEEVLKGSDRYLRN
jgi:ADP-heptose:LPS heptosyltransferase